MKKIGSMRPVTVTESLRRAGLLNQDGFLEYLKSKQAYSDFGAHYEGLCKSYHVSPFVPPPKPEEFKNSLLFRAKRNVYMAKKQMIRWQAIIDANSP